MLGSTNSQVIIKDLSATHYKGTVVDYSSLPVSPYRGDIYKVVDENSYYMWTGSVWDKIGDIDLSSYLTKSEASSTYATKEQVNTYVHNQGIPSAVWEITHNLGKFPSVTVVDSALTEVVGDIQYIDNNSIRITFSGSFSGKAYLN